MSIDRHANFLQRHPALSRWENEGGADAAHDRTAARAPDLDRLQAPMAMQILNALDDLASVPGQTGPPEFVRTLPQVTPKGTTP